MRKLYLFTIVFICMIVNVGIAQEEFPVLTGPYFGQTTPKESAEIFASGIISIGLNESNLIFSPDGNHLFYVVHDYGMETIIMSTKKNGNWTKPEVAPFSGQYLDGFPSFHPNGSRLFFHSSRPLGTGTKPDTAINIWYVEKNGNGWFDPKPVGPPINGDGNVTSPSVTKDGTLYFSKQSNGEEAIYRSEFSNGKYTDPKRLPDNVNTQKYQYHITIAPDESYIIVPLSGRDDLIGVGYNYYVSFRDQNDNWSNLINVGESVNSYIRSASFPSISADGKYFFFQAYTKVKAEESFEKKLTLLEIKNKILNNPDYQKPDIYWISSKIIEDLKPGKIK